MRRKTFNIVSILIMLAYGLSPAYADIYQYVDDKGVIHFTNVSASSKGKRPARIHPEAIAAASLDATSTEAAALPSKQALQDSRSHAIPATFAEFIDKACEKYGVDPSLVHAVVKVESDFNPFALSRKGAMGLMQLMPQTAVDLNVRNSFSPRENIDGGVKYLRSLLDKYEGNIQLALAAYNAGETSVKKWGTVPPFKETRDYVKKIMKLYNGGEPSFSPRNTIYVGYSADGVLLLTDNPSNHPGKQLRRKRDRSL